MTSIGNADIQFRQNIPTSNIQKSVNQNYSQTPITQNIGDNKFVTQNQAGKLIARNEDIRKLAKPKENKTKKYVTTALLTLGTITGLAILGNRSSNYMANLGHKVDDLLLKQNWYKSFEKGFTNTKNKLKNFFLDNNNKLIKDSANDIAETLRKRKSGPTVDLARGYGQGFTTIFALTPVDVLRTSLTKIEKTTFSAYQTDEFKNEFKKLKNKNILIFGIETHICVLQTVIDLLNENYNVYIIEDCSSSRNQNNHKTALALAKQKGAYVITLEIALFNLLKSSKHQNFKEIQSLIK